ncbi:MAG: GGDEF domain-containing protein [Proteobacteria bacterium]|nr:GGDEF domain-containing protein [Pseudomonadota bacterium]
MEFDPRTLMVASIFVTGLMGAVSFMFSAMRGISAMVGRWGVAMLLLALAFGGIALRGVIPDLFSIALANTLVVLALAIALRSLRRFTGESAHDLQALGLTAFAFVLFVIFSEFRPNLGVRIVVISSATIMILVRAALLLHRHTPPECKLSYRFTAAVFWVAVAAAAARLLGALTAPPEGLLVPNLAQSAAHLFNLCFVTAATLGVMLMEFETLQAKLVRSALTDPLTGLANRAGFEREFDRELSRVARDGDPFSVVMFDLDHFKNINDQHGHATGDRALRTFADLLSATVRTHDVAARYGGEEFVLLMPDTESAEALHVAERVRERLEKKEIKAGRARVLLTVSGGVAHYGAHGKDFDSLLKAADDALYAAKAAGRNRIVPATGVVAPAAGDALAAG